ncbi:MAG TPA: hypothetical protein VHY76_11840, partial [Acetobacteraceae bacterium]|nr:hypothetical protein [Acetobacteraceae bacterium]
MIAAGELMKNFESLGDNCEFGILQRRCGVEPLGLLRWATSEIVPLIQALGARFDGFGDAANIEIHTGANGEYTFIDRKFGFRSHTFIKASSISAEAMHAQECRRQSFLRDKMIDTLESGQRIFVYKKATLPPLHAIREIHEGLQRYGRNRLLWVTLADARNAAGTLELVTEGLLRGYIDHFSPYENVPSDISVQCWTTICRIA